MKRTLGLTALVVLALIVVACAPAPTPAPTAAPPTAAPKAPTAAGAALPDLKGRALKVGSDTTYPPFESVNDKKEIVGFDVDMVNEICRRVNCKATFITADFSTIFTAVASKQYDMGASGATITDDRKKIVTFSDPYFVNTQTVLVRADESRIKGKDDLSNTAYIVGVQNGTSNEIVARKLIKEARQLKLYDTFDLAVAALKNKTVDAVVIDTFAAFGYMDDPSNKGAFKLAGEQFSAGEFFGMFFPPDSTELVNAFNAGLKAALKDGTLTKLCEKWWPDPKQRPDCTFKGLPQMSQ